MFHFLGCVTFTLASPSVVVVVMLKTQEHEIAEIMMLVVAIQVRDLSLDQLNTFCRTLPAASQR